MKTRALLSVVVLLAGCQAQDVVGTDAGSDGSVDAAIPRDAPRPPPDAWDAGPPPEDLEGFIEYQMTLGHIPGLAAAVIVDGEIARVVTRGMATDTTDVDEHTLFQIASISKTFVAALVLSLVEEGRLSLDEPVETYLGYPVRSPDAPDTPVTVRQLMTHTSGLTDDWPELGTFTTIGDSPVTLAEFASTYLSDPTHFDAAPETRAEYCNAAFGVLGAIVEAAGEEDMRARTARLFVEPLALDGAGWFIADVDETRLADEYSTVVGGFSAQPQRGYAHYPATSMHISVIGLSRWLIMHMQGGELDGTRALTEESVAETARVQYPSLSGGQGLVWQYRTLAGERWLGHSGSGIGTSTNVLYREGRGLVLLTNSDAYLRNRFGQPDGDAAMDAIVLRLAQEAETLATAP